MGTGNNSKLLKVMKRGKAIVLFPVKMLGPSRIDN